MNNDAVLAILTYVDGIIEKWQRAEEIADPDHQYINEEIEITAENMKQEFRDILNEALNREEPSAEQTTDGIADFIY